MNEHDKIKAARAEYAREYRRKNPEKIRAIQERYWAKKFHRTEEARKGNGRKATSDE